MRKIAHWLAAFLLLPSLALAQGYEVLDKPAVRDNNPETVLVHEFFSYACPHCYTFRPRLEAWAEKTEAPVEIVRVPVVFQPSWEPLAKAYYVAEVLGALDKIHVPLFEAIHAENRRILSEKQLVDFFVEQGLAREQVEQTFKSFPVDMKLRQAKQLADAYRIMSTPTLGVEGRYLLNPRASGGQEGMLAELEKLVRKEAE